MWNPTKLFNDTLDRLVMLSKQPAWKAYAWHEAQKLGQDTTGLFTGMDDALKARMIGPVNTKASADPALTKPR
jgi:hypothetical protein